MDGIAWGCERMGPLQNVIGGTWTHAPAFPASASTAGRRRASAASPWTRAQTATANWTNFRAAAAKDQRPADGYFVSFWRLLLDYPEILSWEKLWTDSYHEVRAGTVRHRQGDRAGKAVRLSHHAEHDLQPVLPGGRRLLADQGLRRLPEARDLQQRRRSAYGGLPGPPERHRLPRRHARRTFCRFYYKIMNYQEGAYEELHNSGLSADYVARETKRAVAGVAARSKIYPGSISTSPRSGPISEPRPTMFDSRSAPHSAGADGVVLSREYVEMWLANLSAAGETLRDIFSKRAAEFRGDYPMSDSPWRSSPLRSFCCVLSVVRAQAVANAEIRGVITDPTGALFPGAQVKATQTDTGTYGLRSAATDGSYVLPNLPVGPYRLEVSAPSFSSTCSPASSCRSATTSRSMSRCRSARVTQESGLVATRRWSRRRTPRSPM